MNRVCGHSSVNDDNVPARTQLAIELKPLDIILQTWKIRLSLERNLRINIHKEGKIRLRKQPKKLKTQSRSAEHVMQAGHSVNHHVQRIPVAYHSPTKKQRKNELYTCLHNILNLSENAP